MPDVEENAFARKAVYSFRADSVCSSYALERCGGVEWLLSAGPIHNTVDRLHALRMKLPYDVSSQERFIQRIDLLRGSVGRSVPIGVAMIGSSLIANFDIIAVCQSTMSQ